VAALGLLVSAPVASAAPQDWAGSTILTTSSSTATTAIRAAFSRTSWGENPRLLVRTTVSSPGGQPAGCELAQPTPPTNVGWDGSRFLTEAFIAPPCNGTYGLTISAALQNRSCFQSICGDYRTIDTYDLTGSVAISAPAPDVDARADVNGGRTVVVSWDEPGGLPPDFLGYRIQRQSTKGTWTTIATLDAPDAPTSYTDGEPPAAGGATTYRVLTRRAGPDGEVMSSGGSPATANVEPSPDGTGATSDGGSGSTGDAATGDPGTGGSGGATSGGVNGAATSGGGRPGGRVAAPRIGITGAFLPPLLQPRVPTVAGATTATTIDDGFDETLPYEAGEEDPVLPDDEMASIVTSEVPGRGMAIPIATALVLAVWAFHLRVLARAARPS
jgi:hypothetical protein